MHRIKPNYRDQYPPELRKFIPRLRKFLYSSKYRVGFISRLDWGYRWKNGTPRRYSSKRLVEIYDALPTMSPLERSRLDRLTEKKLFEHYSSDIKYYTSDSLSPYALLGTDIDAKQGEDDALEMAAFLKQKYFPDSYIERSTGGHGGRNYFIVDKELGFRRLTTSEVNEANKELRTLAIGISRFLREETKAMGFKSRFDAIKGTCSYYDYSNGRVLKRGSQLNIPMLRNRMADLEALQRLQPIPMSYLRQLYQELKEREQAKVSAPIVAHPLEGEQTRRTAISLSQGEKEMAFDDTPAATGPREKKQGEEDTGSILGVRSVSHCHVITSNDTQKEKEEERETGTILGRAHSTQGLLFGDYDQNQRKIRTISQLIDLGLINKANPDVNFCLNWYEAHVFHTGERDSRRYDNMMSAIRYAMKWHRKRKKQGGEETSSILGVRSDTQGLHLITETDYTALIKKYVEPNKLWYKQGKQKRPLSYQDLNIFVQFCTQTAFSVSEYTEANRSARDRIQQWFRHLKSTGRHDTLCGNHKYQGCLLLLEGILMIHDDYLAPQHYIKSGQHQKINGYGRLIGPGPLHPLFGEFQAFLKEHDLLNVSVKTSTDGNQQKRPQTRRCDKKAA